MDAGWFLLVMSTAIGIIFVLKRGGDEESKQRDGFIILGMFGVVAAVLVWTNWM